MAAKRAKTLTDAQLVQVLEYVGKTSKQPLRDYTMVLLSFKGALRAAEIAGLSWRDVTDAFGNVRSDLFEVPDGIAKKGHGRAVPMHRALYAALCALKATQHKDATRGKQPVIPGLHGPRMSPNNLQKYMARLYQNMGLEGVSSHSGRRTFITKAIRSANKYDCSIKDVQGAVGHRHIDTTENYIDPSDNVGRLINAI